MMIMSKLSVVIIDAPGMHQVLKLFLILTAFRQDSRFHHPLCLYQCTRGFGSNSQLVVGAAGEEGLAAVSPPPCRQSHIE